MVGQTISHYTILEKLGEGGMGVVYKARDTKLDRDVALKFLPHDLVVTDEERARFLREAKAISALDHPNICTIHEVDQTTDGRMFIVMGYYEGTPLSKKITKGRLEITEAVGITVQIAEGLQAAHDKGVVHRDIKSSNIILTDNGQVKILDFGLAQKRGLSKLTKTGTTVGTASYMSPEQARGEAIDHRSDLWSLGVVLYEMVTGQLPFRGGHDMAILYSVVNEEPQPVEALVPDAPPELLHIIRRALEKDPAERYQSAADMLIDLRRLKKDTSRTGFTPMRTDPFKSVSSRRNTFILAGGVFLLICIIGYQILVDRDIRVNPKFTQRIVQVPFKTVSAPSVSPDGKYLVFAGADMNNKWQLYITGVGGGQVRQLTDDPDVTEGAMPSISPDGTGIVYHRTTVEGADIVIIPFIGGTGKKIGSGNAAKWSPDGSRIGYLRMPRNSPVGPYSKSGRPEFWTMKADGTDNRIEFIDTIATTIVSRGFSITFSFAWSPDGQRVAWVRPLPQMYCEIVLHDLSTHEEIPLVTDTTWKNELCWGTNDQIIYSSRNFKGWNLWTVPAAGGEPVQVTRGSSYEDIPTISNDCRIVTFWQSGNTGFLKGVQLDGSDRHFDVASGDNILYDWVTVSPDGRWVAFASRTPFSPESHIQVIKIDGTNQRQLTFGDTYDDNPYWSPDGRMIAYNSRRIFEPPESTKVFILNFEKPETPRFVHHGTCNGWRDSASLDVQMGARYWIAYLDERPPERPSYDSVFAVPILGGRYTLFFDWRIAGGDALRVCRTTDWDKKGPSNSWPIWNGSWHGIVRDRGIYVFKSENELLRIIFPDGRQERVPATFPGISLNRYRVRLTKDGLMMCYKVNKSYSKLGVIENLFE